MEYSLADIRSAVDGDRDGVFGDNGFLWVILIFLFFLAFSGDGLFGNRNNGMSQVERDVLTTSCGTQKEVLQNRYDNALQTQTLSAQMAQCLKRLFSQIKLFICKLFGKRKAIGTYT